MKTEVIAVPSGWEHLPYHPLSKTVEFGIGINVEEMALFMKEHGYDENESIIIYRDQILDGRHKHAAAIIAGITPTFRRFVGKSAEAYVAKKAFRQHLSASQRAMLAADIANATRGGDRKSEKIKAQECASIEIAAKTLNVSARSVDNAAKIQKSGTPELQQAVREGAITVTDAASVAVEESAIQEEAVKQVKEKKAKTAKAAVEKIKEAAPESESIKDAVGNTVPEKALPAFDDAKRIGTICKEIDAVIKSVEEIGKSPGGKMLHTTSQMQTLQNVRKSLWQGRATHVCPYCKGAKACTPCDSRGWTTKTFYDQSPESIRNK